MKIIEVVAAILLRGDSFMIAKRPKGKIFEGLWEFPGGKVELGEKLENALYRENFEELNIEVDIKKLSLFDSYSVYRDSVSFRLNFFFCSFWYGELSPKEGQKLNWITKKEISNYNFLNSNKRVLKKLNTFIPHCK